ncbi:MAG: hypothetical protein QJR09_02880 [Micrococcus sp.]|nr:hypothetical protein [Micrococcus sp.]
MWKNAGQSPGSVTVLDGTPAVSTLFTGSVSGHLDVPAGVTVDIHGVLEDALVSGAGTVRVSGLIAGVFARDGGTLLARAGSVLAPEDEDAPWLVLQDCGRWAESADLVFPTAAVAPEAADARGTDWWPVPLS